MTNKFQAINNYVLLEMQDLNLQRVGDIELPEAAQKNPRWGRVISVGPGVPDTNGQNNPPDVQVGDLAYVMAHGRQEIQLNALGEYDTMHMASALDLMATLEEIDMVLKPLASYIEIQPLETTEELENIILPDGQKGLPTLARVVRLGTGFVTISGVRVPFHVKEGDIVAYNPLMTMAVDVGQLTNAGKRDVRTLIAHANIMGFLQPEEK